MQKVWLMFLQMHVFYQFITSGNSLFTTTFAAVRIAPEISSTITNQSQDVSKTLLFYDQSEKVPILNYTGRQLMK